jgi:hypothetical protein
MATFHFNGAREEVLRGPWPNPEVEKKLTLREVGRKQAEKPATKDAQGVNEWGAKRT